VRPTELPDTIRIAFSGFSPQEFDEPEPVFADIIGLEDFDEPVLATSDLIVEFDEPARLDPKRSGLIWEIPPAVAVWAIRWRAPVAALALHLLPLVAIILMPLLLVEPPPPIPVQLVFEQPPPPPPPPPQPQQAPPKPQPPPPKMETGRLSSVDMGVVKPDLQLGRSTDPVQQPSAAPRQPDPAETETATQTPPPPVPVQKPPPPQQQKSAFLLPLPKPSGANVPRHEEVPHEAPHSARYAGMASTRDEYLAYLVSLTRQHIGLLPMSFIGDRRGETVISVTVYDNGGIGPIGIIRSSGYPDVDGRIEQMVRAVGKFPPLPQWYQGDAVQLELTLKFPDALQHAE
jgi:periplasmic protein TonB